MGLCGNQAIQVTQLREALAIDPVSGCINQGNMPLTQDLLKSCSSLIIEDSNDQIILTHYSVRQFLEDRRADARLFPTVIELNTAELDLGKLCVTHLTSSDYALAVQQSSDKKAQPLMSA